jgi:hypothetical protein
MTSNRHSRRLLAGLLLLLPLVWAADAATQVSTGEAVKVESPKSKKEKFKGEVLAATRQSIIIRGLANKNLVRTFSYNEKVAAKINKWFDENKLFQHGDRVEIVYLAGTDKAIKLKGKPGQNR